MPDEEVHTLRAVFGGYLEAAAASLTPHWAELDNDARNQVRGRLAAAAIGGRLDRLIAAARLLRDDAP